MNNYDKHKSMVIHSALWAAAGDALGWITELTNGNKSIVRTRAGSPYVTEPVTWKRTIGGRFGPNVTFPAGTYSDDTQLRLAVSRSIRGDGVFDVETFAKVELTVWPTYALGGGIGTKAAAVNLSKRTVNWFSNFYEREGSSYINSGGNGAAMRVQPHIWASKALTTQVLTNVFKDSIVTHGHPHGFLGAIFHSYCLSEVIKQGEVPNPNNWLEYLEYFNGFEDIINADPQLKDFWLPSWESHSGKKLFLDIEKTSKEFREDIYKVISILSEDPKGYKDVITALGCDKKEYRGSGLKTALAASALAYLFKEKGVESALVEAANMLDTDTDTIATMTGAILGAVSKERPKWALQDSFYIEREAGRLADIAFKIQTETFVYPDLLKWSPPTSQTLSVGALDDGLAMAGLGSLKCLKNSYKVGEYVWQWFELPFGQSILAKVKTNPDDMSLLQLPKMRAQNQQTKNQKSYVQPDSRTQLAMFHSDENTNIDSLDVLTDIVINSNFDNEVLGRAVNQYIETTSSVESAIAFIAIISKAKIARMKKK
ncbi:ADP-ribosylglycohydrolase family protein [Rheinheimera aquimaris]|uniref:ADP-ribosylglycohydrolase family protein n=1 Tax=Rheinheimera aquimaris TaxID=412437 RepID=A0ABP3PCA4_9GAMM|nr:ADP-ribosylglycohydrolase family protein [Rheinheimera aquimaris]MCB5215164.1 ADP-ribosylglycohydrolase family protein [Rheinheimera aquimaris]